MPPRRKEEWLKNNYQPSIRKSPEDRADFKLTSGIEISPLYTGEDIRGVDLEESLGYPGEYPFGRGIQPTMYRGRLWTMRQYSGFASAEESNRRYRYLL